MAFIIDQDIGRLDIAVNNPVLMREGHALAGLPQDL